MNTVLNCIRLLSDAKTQHNTTWANTRVKNKATWAARMEADKRYLEMPGTGKRGAVR